MHWRTLDLAELDDIARKPNLPISPSAKAPQVVESMEGHRGATSIASLPPAQQRESAGWPTDDEASRLGGKLSRQLDAFRPSPPMAVTP